MAARKTIPAKKTRLLASELTGAKQLPLGARSFFVQLPSMQLARPVPAADGAQALVRKVASAVKTPGIPEASVFRGAQADKVFAYSVLPGDSSKVVRITRDGRREVGTMGQDGRFRARKQG